LKNLIEILSEKWEKVIKKNKSLSLYLCPFEEIWIPSEITFFSSDESSKAYDIGDIFTAYGRPATNVLFMHYQWVDIPLSPIQGNNIQVQIPENPMNNITPPDNQLNSQQILITNLPVNTNSLLAQPSLNLNDNSILSEEIDDFLSGSEEDKEKSFIPLAQEYDEFDPLEFLGIYKSHNRLKISPSVNFNSYDSLDEEDYEERSEDEKEMNNNEIRDEIEDQPDCEEVKETKKEKLAIKTNDDDHTNDPYQRFDYFSKMKSKFPNNLEDSSNNIFVKNIDNNIKSNLFSISENESRLEKSGDYSKDNNISKILNFQDFNSKIKSNPTVPVNSQSFLNKTENPVEEKIINYKTAFKKDSSFLNDKRNNLLINSSSLIKENNNSNSLVRKNSDNSANNTGINENSSDIKAKRRINFQNNFNPTEEGLPLVNQSLENNPEYNNDKINDPNTNNILSKDFKDLNEKISNSFIVKQFENSNRQNTIQNQNLNLAPNDSNLNISYFQSLNKNRTFDNYLNSSKDKYNSLGQVFSHPREEISHFNENTNLFNVPNFILNEESMNIMKQNNNSNFMPDSIFYSNQVLSSNLFRNPEDTRRFNSNVINNQNSSICFKNVDICSPIEAEHDKINNKNNINNNPEKNTINLLEKKVLNKKTKRNEVKITNKNKSKKMRSSPVKLEEILDDSDNLSKNKSRKSKSQNEKYKDKELQINNEVNFNNSANNFSSNNLQNLNQGYIPGQGFNPNMNIQKFPGSAANCGLYPNLPLMNYHNPHNINISTSNPYIFNQNNFFHGFNPQMDSRVYAYYNLPVDIPHPSCLNPANQIPFYPQMDPNMLYRIKKEKSDKFVVPKDNKNF
jgi:hypothetical protein